MDAWIGNPGECYNIGKFSRQISSVSMHFGYKYTLYVDMVGSFKFIIGSLIVCLEKLRCIIYACRGASAPIIQITTMYNIFLVI